MLDQDFTPESRRLWESYRNQYQLIVPEERLIWGKMSQEKRDRHLELLQVVKDKIGILAKVRIIDHPDLSDWVLYHEKTGQFVQGEITISGATLRRVGWESTTINKVGKSDEAFAYKVARTFEEYAAKAEAELKKLVL